MKATIHNNIWDMAKAMFRGKFSLECFKKSNKNKLIIIKDTGQED